MGNGEHVIGALKLRTAQRVAAHFEDSSQSPDPKALIEELATASVQGIIILGPKNIEFCNARARELNGVPKSVLDAGKPWLDFFQYQMDRGDFGEGDAAQRFFDNLVANFKSRKVMQVERSAGDGRVVRADRIPNSIGGMTLTLTDISELKTREAELLAASQAAQVAEQAKSDFLANMSHELRTPLNGILGMADVLSMSELDADQKEAADVIVGSAEALVEVVQDVLEVSRLDLGQVSVVKEPFDLAQVLRNLVAEYGAAAAHKGLGLSFRDAALVMPPISGDRRILRQTLSHILDNAIRFTEVGQVEVALSWRIGEEGTVQANIEARDTGVGIAEADLATIFDRFTQANASSARQHDGAGLGLSLAKAYVDLAGGEISVTSVIGEGSCFAVNIGFPLAAEEGDALPAAAS